MDDLDPRRGIRGALRHHGNCSILAIACRGTLHAGPDAEGFRDLECCERGLPYIRAAVYWTNWQREQSDWP